MTWINVPENIEDYEAFVYCITNKITGEYYVGLKKFWKIVKYPPLKGRINKRHKKRPSDFESYWGSSEDFLKNVEKYGKDNFERKIIYLCKTKSLANLMELKEQIDRNVLFDDKSYNRILNVRINSNMVKGYDIPKRLE